MKVYLLEHLMVYLDYEDTKFIGIFMSKYEAMAVINKLKRKPGFKNAPKLIDPLEDGYISGFIIQECSLNQFSWQDGFG